MKFSFSSTNRSQFLFINQINFFTFSAFLANTNNKILQKDPISDPMIIPDFSDLVFLLYYLFT